MDLIRVLLFSSWAQGCFGGGCFTKFKFGAKRSGPLLQDVQDERIEELNQVLEVRKRDRYIAIIKAARYEMRPLVKPNWKEEEEIIGAMVDEAKYNAGQAQKLTPSHSNGPNIEALEKLRSYSRQVLTLAQQEALKLRLNKVPGLPQPKLPYNEYPHVVKSIAGVNSEPGVERSSSQIIHPSQGSRASIGLFQSASKKNKGTMFTRSRSYEQSSRWLGSESSNFLSRMRSRKKNGKANLFCDPALVGKELTEGMRDFILAILPPCDPSQYKKVAGHIEFIKEVLRTFDFLYKYRFINEAEINAFFSRPHMLKLTGQHIATTFLHGYHDPTSTPQLDIDHLVISRETDHIRNCLAGLNDKSRTWVIHFAFSSFYNSAAVAWDWEPLPSPLKEIATFLTQQESVAPVIERKYNKEIIENRIFEYHLPTLIQIFEHPPGQRQNESQKDYITRVKVIYMQNFTLLFHVVQNLCNDQNLRYLTLQNPQFRAKYRLFVIGSRISELEMRWSLYSSYGLQKQIRGFPDSQINSEKHEIEKKLLRIGGEYFKISEKLGRDENSLGWKNNVLIQQLLNDYSTHLGRVSRTMKRDILTGNQNEHEANKRNIASSSAASELIGKDRKIP